MGTPTNPVSLTQWRRTVAELYASVRASAESNAERAAAEFRSARDRLFIEHDDSPIPAAHRAGWRGASWYPYNPAWRVAGRLKPAAIERLEIALAVDGAARCTRFATVEFSVRGVAAALPLYWFEGYGGGLWLPFGDSTNGVSTYGGGRYLYDTIKGADLGADADSFVLDFNFAYNPSCAFDDRWSCPLPFAESRLPFEVPVGERTPQLGA